MMYKKNSIYKNTMQYTNYKVFFKFILLVAVICLVSSGCNKDKSLQINENIEIVKAEKDKEQGSNSSEYNDYIIYLMDKADKGDPNAQNKLANAFFYGSGVEKDYYKTLYWSTEAAKKGNLASMFNIGYIYYFGYTGEVNYDLSFEWYKKAADKMYPKALNAIGEMYYKGNGVDKNIELAIEYTKQSAGFLHNYSLSNLGVIADEKGNIVESNYWYKLASQNYFYPTGTNDILYERVKNGEIEIDVENQISSTSIPTELISDVINRYYSGTLTDYLKDSSEKYIIEDTENLALNEDAKSLFEYSRWYDTSYILDIDYDKEDELVVYSLQGTSGSSLLYVIEKTDGKYNLDESSIVSGLWHGINGFVEYDGNKYFVVANISLVDHSINSVYINQFEGSSISDTVVIDRSCSDLNIIKTYQENESYNALDESIVKRINDMYLMDFNKLKYDKLYDLIVIDDDLNNDNKLDHLEYISTDNGTINVPLYLNIRGEYKDKEYPEYLKKILTYNDIVIPIGIEVFSDNGKNYVSVLSYCEGTNIQCMTTYYIENDDVKVIMNHLISFIEKYTIENGNYDWQFEQH